MSALLLYLNYGVVESYATIAVPELCSGSTTALGVALVSQIEEAVLGNQQYSNKSSLGKTKVYGTSLAKLAPNYEKLAKYPPCYHIYHVTFRHWVTTFSDFLPKKNSSLAPYRTPLYCSAICLLGSRK
ncbi:hypothetical protein AVEN_168775-1 [Araneus ventricosus]|uniref:Uncharacterized protein n=1 Tax=Araneus ventricosus TaxID=182803 RepID=A0A4Y2GDD9_ARAVE|nr:hypothetical protein AVEN_168775-1 [Araneus ventricosus]